MTTFHQVSVGLSNGQEKKLKSAVNSGLALSLRLKPENLVGKHKLLLTQTQLNKLNKAKSKRKGIVLKISQNQIKKTGGSLFSLIPTLAKAALPTAAKALKRIGRTFFWSRKSFERDFWKWWDSTRSN